MKKNRIAFYIELDSCKSKIENANFELGNPGLGGTQYLFLLTVKYLNRFYGNCYAVLLSNTDVMLKDTDIDIISVGSHKDAIKYCERESISYLVFNANMVELVNEKIFNTSVKIMLWAHNTLNWKRQKLAKKIKSIYKVICVSEKQFLNMKDTPCFFKCTYINNVFTREFYKKSLLTDYSEKKVVYVGSLMPQKGVHNLLKIWKYVEKKVPTAQLYIYGGANVWNPSLIVKSKTGADLYFDRIIQRKLKQIRNQSNIHFMGSKGWEEINRSISTTMVGVVNPSHYMRDETFCLSAIELEAHGIPIVSRKRSDGLETSILNGQTGFLEKSDKEIANKIVFLLNNRDECIKYGKKAKEYVEKFIVDGEIYKWNDLICAETENNLSAKSALISKDTILLKHDYLLKICYLLMSGKLFDLFIKKIKK